MANKNIRHGEQTKEWQVNIGMTTKHKQTRRANISMATVKHNHGTQANTTQARQTNITIASKHQHGKSTKVWHEPTQASLACKHKNGKHANPSIANQNIRHGEKTQAWHVNIGSDGRREPTQADTATKYRHSEPSQGGTQTQAKRPIVSKHKNDEHACKQKHCKQKHQIWRANAWMAC